MRRLLSILVGAALALSPVWVNGENGFTNVSATQTSQTVTFSNIQSSVMLCNYGTDVNHYRIFTNEDTAAAATTAHASLVAGSATAPACVTFKHNPSSQRGTGWLAVSIVCDTAETATVHVITE